MRWKNWVLLKKLINLTKTCLEGFSSVVRINEAVSSSFTINNGLKQGDALSSMLFSIALEKVVRTANTESLLFTNQGQRLILAVADDIDIVGIPLSMKI